MNDIMAKGLTVTGGAGKLIAVHPDEPKPKQSKYGNKKTLVDGILFDSKKESQRYQELAIEQKIGTIQGLRMQVKFDLIVNDFKVCSYHPDFVYQRDGKTVVEDVKSESTRKKESYRIKNKLMKAIYNIEIIEV